MNVPVKTTPMAIHGYRVVGGRSVVGVRRVMRRRSKVAGKHLSYWLYRPTKSAGAGPGAVQGMIDRITDLDDQLTRLLRRLRHPQVRRLLTAGVTDPLERGPTTALVRIAQDEPMRLSDLAASLDVDVSTASRQARTLLDAGLVERTPDPVDGRACRYSTTSAGRSRLEEMRAARRRALAGVADSWSAPELRQLVDLLSRFVDDLEDAARQPSP